METKTCTGCGEEKPATTDHFYLNGSRLYSYCKPCQRERRKNYHQKNHTKSTSAMRQYYKDNIERAKERNRQWKKENTNYNKEYLRLWRKNNPEKDREYSRRWRANNPIKAKEVTKRYQINNLHNSRQRCARRYAIKLSNTVGDVCYESILSRDGYICHICNKTVDPNDIHFDHVVPLSRGGSHSMENIKVSHSTCNISKGVKLMSELTIM